MKLTSRARRERRKQRRLMRTFCSRFGEELRRTWNRTTYSGPWAPTPLGRWYAASHGSK